MKQPDFWTPSQLAERWACSSKHVQRLCLSGLLRAFRLGAGKRSEWRIPMDAVTDFEESQSNQPEYHRRRKRRLAKTEGIRDLLGN